MAKKWVRRWFVDSESRIGCYTVSQADDGSYGCSCPAWKFQRAKLPNQECKHIEAVKESLLQSNSSLVTSNYVGGFRVKTEEVAVLERMTNGETLRRL